MSDFVLGKYVHKDTPIHKLDPRLKVFGMILFMVASFLSYGTFITTFIFQGILLLFVFSLIIVSQIKFSAILNIGPAPAVITKSLFWTWFLKYSVISSKVLM